MKLRGVRIMRIWLAMIALAFASPGAQTARSDELTDRILAAYRTWHAAHNLMRSSIAVIRAGQVISSASLGKGAPDRAEGVASVSKSITGMCVVKLVEQGRLHYSDNLGRLLGRFFARFGAPADPRFVRITVAQLLNQTSGIGDGNIDSRKIGLADQMRDTVKIHLIHDPGGPYHYENKNFQVLGLIVEVITHMPYEQACRDLVLRPAGVRGAHISRIQPYMSSWAGWEISAEDLARFMRSFDPRYGILRTGPRDWPKVDLGNRFFYGPGVHLRHNEDDSYTVFHTGVWTWSSGTLHRNFMSRYVYFGSGIGFAIDFSPKVDGAGSDLEHQIWLAMVATHSTAAAKPQPVGPTGRIDYSTDRPGNDYRVIELTDGVNARCRQACVSDSRCTAYTIVRPAPGDSRFTCRLKSPTPQTAVRDFCCATEVIR